jgi:Xaa-Pro aminopeptidase
VLNYVRGSPPTLAGEDDEETAFLSRIRARFFGLTLRDVTPGVHALRRVKDAGEVQAIERAVALTRQALERVRECLGPGVHERELEAEITRIYRRGGATHAFEPIVACGVNAAYPHYRANAARLSPGQLVLIDTGATLAGYRSDVTRTFPLDGRFTPRQRQVYAAVLAAQRAAIARCRPGALLADLHAQAFESITAAGFGPHFIHGIGHHLGLETHDAGDVHAPLEEGCVITVEPGVYIPGEEIGVRIEDDVLVTADGPRVLTEAIPAAIEELERGRV